MALPTASDNPFPSILLNETTAPSSPSASKRRLYIDSNHVFRWKDSGGVDTPLVALNKWDATVAPTANEDSGDGYAVGSRWIDTTHDKEYVCLDSTVGAAVWTETTATGTGGGAVSTDTIWDAKGDLVAATGADAAAKVTVGSNGTGLIADSSASNGVSWKPGASVLLYDFTITGSDQRTIDTFVDDGGHGASASLPTDYRILEIFLYARSDGAVTTATVDWFFNNDTATNYNGLRLRSQDTTVTALSSLARAGFFCSVPAASDAANVFGTAEMRVPGYATTGNYRSGQGMLSIADTTAGNVILDQYGFLWKNTANAINRVMVRDNDGSRKLKVGSRLMVYAR